MEIDFLDLVLAAVGAYTLGGSIVSAVVEPVTLPCGSGEFGPLNVVRQQLAGGGVHNIKLLPVAAASGNGVCEVLSVVAEKHSLEGHGAVIAQGIGIEHHPGLAVGAVHLVQHALVLQSVVLVEVPFTVLATHRRPDLLVIVHLLQALQQLATEAYAFEIMVGVPVLGLHPGGCLVGKVVLQPAVGIGHGSAEIIVNGRVFACLRHLRRAGSYGK